MEEKYDGEFLWEVGLKKLTCERERERKRERESRKLLIKFFLSVRATKGNTMGEKGIEPET